MKVLLTNHPLTTGAEEYIGGQCFPPLGLLYIASVLEQKGVEVKILDCLLDRTETLVDGDTNKRTGLSEESIKREIKSFDPDIVGISNMYTAFSKDASKIAEIVKNLDKKILVVIGGAHPSSNPDIVLQDKNIDLVVKGEGENTILEIVDALSHATDITNIAGTVVRKNGTVVENPMRPLIKDLDTIPYPARHLVPIEQYLKNWKDEINYNMRIPVTNIISSRGCPGKCVYCAVKNVWGGRNWRSRSPAKVVDEMEYLANTYGVREIIFSDDTMSVNKDRMAELCKEILKRKIDIRWAPPTGIAVWTLEEPLLDLMKQSGCYRLTFGLESGNAETLKFLGKNYSYSHALRIIDYSNRIGIWTAGTFIIGFPNEDMKSVEDTISFAINSPLDFAVFYTPVVFRGTPLWDMFRELNMDVREKVDGVMEAYDTKYFTGKELNEIRNKANKDFLRSRMKRPWKFLTKIRSFEDLLYTGKITMNISTLILAKFSKLDSATAFVRRTKK